MGNVLSKQDVKSSQGHIMDQVKLMFNKVKALTHTKSGQIEYGPRQGVLSTLSTHWIL